MATIRLNGVDIELEVSAVPMRTYHTGGPKKPRRPAVAFTLRICPNCGAVWESPGRKMRVYCSLACDDAARAVRYARQKREEFGGGPLRPDIAEAVRIKIVHAVSGGYNEAERHLSREQKDAVRQRDHGKCVLCQEPGTEIDHIEGPSSDMFNLRLLCTTCHRTVTLSHVTPITEADQAALARQLQERVEADTPLRVCDVNGWDWKAWCQGAGLASV